MLIETMTSTDIDLIEEAYVLSSMVTQSEVFKEYHGCKYKLSNDKEAQSLIKEFVKIKDSYEDVQRFGKYHPDYDRISKEVREVKRKLDLNDTIAKFKAAEKNLDALLIEISTIIAREVSETIKVPTGNPFFDNMSCSGGCSSGKGCGCK